MYHTFLFDGYETEEYNLKACVESNCEHIIFISP